ncbi:MAG: helicase-associated domain-containing protein [Labilithrix sp.]|nr:helicase-associated domain-containing protein [Labilithrix sp.]MCW5811459.1 helicase-associated domain-containing protein [Labilithrix sp.]
MRDERPIIVQSDGSILLETHAPGADEARGLLAPFAELVKSPEHVHTYRVTALSIWNARAVGMTAETMVETLHAFARYTVPATVIANVRELAARYGLLTLDRTPDGLRLSCVDPETAERIARDKTVGRLLRRSDDRAFDVDRAARGELKQALVRVGFPVDDRAGYSDGSSLDVRLRETCVLRDYQRAAADAFHQSGNASGGSGVVTLPCGAGKTVVGLAAMAAVGQTTLILTTSTSSVHQWRREILDKTTLADEDVATYTAERKETGPVTLATYQMLTWRASGDDDFPHLALFAARPWGLIVYDEVHLLPAPVFRATADLQTRRRLGLTATLVREDGREGDVFALIGPKRYDVPWRELEARSWIAAARCTEVRVAMPPARRMEYALADRRTRFRIAAENPAKTEVVRDIVRRHPASRVLILGEYVEQLERLARLLRVPVITGKTKANERERLYDDFRRGTTRHLVLSRVGNFAIDLPEADLLIQVSGAFGSRQEEAQRLGRVLRPKADGRGAQFFTLVSRDTDEEEAGHRRQTFLAEQGYAYDVATPEVFQA